MTDESQQPGLAADSLPFHLDERMLSNPATGDQKFLSRNEARLLELLLEGPQTKEALIHRVWGELGVVVTDASYYQLVTQVRNSFEELSLSRKILRTIPRYGLELVPNRAELDDESLDDEPERGEIDTPAENAGVASAPDASCADQQSVPEPAAAGAENDSVGPTTASAEAKPTPRGRFGLLSQITRARYLAILLATMGVALISVYLSVSYTRAPSGKKSKPWIERNVSGIRVYVRDSALSSELIAFYISKAHPENQCDSEPRSFDYYFEETPSVMQMLVYEPQTRLPCVTYYFY
ncbi:winged helix-turn-helix domain-containing protein [Burkholderia vietnamiensis]|nr:hypothetical protein [Burkholderia vietnamiensis]HDR9109859.1 hypothetical protein [Burkholderia vietnamiensis]HDR9143918.1 hypothetical protein [Burkholderia vietnamiensis]HDR9203850.1 hypothetical protein [Burkholderia vietnamiensis]